MQPLTTGTRNVSKKGWTLLIVSCNIQDVQNERIAAIIRARRIEVGLDTIQALVDATGLTRQGLQPLLRGEVKGYQDRLKIPVCRALGWTPDSIDRLLAGDDPIELDEDEHVAPEKSLVSRLDELETEVQRLDRVLRLLGQITQDELPDLALPDDPSGGVPVKPPAQPRTRPASK
jgi:hypothetical protein